MSGTKFKKVYIIGAVTGEDNWEEKFHAAKAEMLALGCTVLSPTDYPLGLSVKEYMMLSVANVFLADCLLVLPGYEKSVGANAEIVLARSIYTHIVFKSITTCKELIN